jgi:hypothetical protein
MASFRNVILLHKLADEVVAANCEGGRVLTIRWATLFVHMSKAVEEATRARTSP